MKIHFKESIIFRLQTENENAKLYSSSKEKGKTMAEWITAYLISFAVTATCFVLTILAARDWHNVRDNDTFYRMGLLAGFTILTIFPFMFIATH